LRPAFGLAFFLDGVPLHIGGIFSLASLTGLWFWVGLWFLLFVLLFAFVVGFGWWVICFAW